MARTILIITLVALVVLSLGGWVYSGRETFTKTTMYIEKEVEDPDWGVEKRTVPTAGPILGYYIGLDAVVVCVATAAVAGGILWWQARRGRAANVKERDVS